MWKQLKKQRNKIECRTIQREKIFFKSLICENISFTTESLIKSFTRNKKTWFYLLNIKKNPPMKVDSKNTNDEKKFILCFHKHWTVQILALFFTYQNILVFFFTNLWKIMIKKEPADYSTDPKTQMMKKNFSK